MGEMEPAVHVVIMKTKLCH